MVPPAGLVDFTVGEKGCASDHRGEHQPAFLPSNQRIQGEGAAFAAVIGLEHKENVFDRGLQGDGPDDARQAADDQLFGDHPVGDDGIEHKEAY